MEKPHPRNITKKRMTWNRSIPKNQRYAGTAVSARNKVPIRNELISQLTLSKGIRENMSLFGIRKIAVRRDNGVTALSEPDFHGAAILHYKPSRHNPGAKNGRPAVAQETNPLTAKGFARSLVRIVPRIKGAAKEAGHHWLEDQARTSTCRLNSKITIRF
jgi:hypothetical protein